MLRNLIIKKLIYLLIFLLSFLLIKFSDVKSVDLIEPWVYVENLPDVIASQSLFLFNNRLYIQGGSNFSVPKYSFYTTVDNSGTLSSWNLALGNLDPIFWHAYTQKDNVFYILGGANASIQNISKVLLGKVESENQIAWTNLTPLPQTLALGASVIINNKIYFSGGNPTPTYDISDGTNQNIYFSSINDDGTIGTWNIAGSLPSKLIGFGMLHKDGYLYVLGGRGPSGITSNFSRSKVNPDGSIDSNWENLNSMPAAVWRFGYVLVNDFIIVAGGQSTNDVITNKVQYIFLGSNIANSNWQYGPDLPFPNCCSPLISFNEYVYLVGGHDGANYTNRVLMSKLLIPSPSPSPTLSPTPTPIPSTSPQVSPSPSPSPKPITKLFLIPGMGASWNIDAFINCKTENINGGWTLAPYAKSVYRNFLEKVPETGWEIFPYYYDWRQNISINSGTFNHFLTSHASENEKVNIVGHSMGGLIAADYLKSASGGIASKLYMVGSPNKGSAYAYPLHIKGEMWNADLIQKISASLFAKHCGIPESTQNILPTYEYLVNSETKQIIPINEMLTKNNYLPQNLTDPFWNVKLGTLAGINQQTLKEINVKVGQNGWPDGKPVSVKYSRDGDGTVLLDSAQIADADANDTLDQTHSGIIGSTEGINKILNFLGSPGIDDPPFEEPKSALVLIGFPGNFWIKDENGNVLQSEQGMISIVNPKTQTYRLHIIPAAGKTDFIVAQFMENGNSYYKQYSFEGLNIPVKTIIFKSQNSQENILYNQNYFPNGREYLWFKALISSFWKKFLK